MTDLDEHALAQAAYAFDVTPQVIAIALQAYDDISTQYPDEPPAERLGKLLEMDGERAIRMVSEYVMSSVWVDGLRCNQHPQGCNHPPPV